MPNRDFDRGRRPWGQEDRYSRGEWEGGPYGGRYGTDESYFRGGYTGGSYYREPGYSYPGGYAGDYARESGPFGYGGGYFGREPYDRYDRERFDRENFGWYGGGYGGAYGRGPYAGGWGREAGREGYFGRGPRGYRRSDERIREDINDRLTWHPEIDASDIEVRVENGEVTLTGVVEDRHSKRLAANIADDVFGVEDVHNELKVRHGFLAGLTGEKAEDREVSRTTEREASEAATRRGTRTGATAGATSRRQG
jgi:hypothetical protein